MVDIEELRGLHADSHLQYLSVQMSFKSAKNAFKAAARRREACRLRLIRAEDAAEANQKG